jgi:Ser/Thr protein kinase RdoA (MazF antagonist)
MDGIAENHVLQQFGIQPGAERLRSVSEGYINKTYAVGPVQAPKFILQQINTAVFPQPEALMSNLERALPLLQAEDYAKVELMRTTTGASWVLDQEGNPWRLFRFVEGSCTFSTADREEIARETGAILGRFHELIAPLDPTSLREVLPRFHDLDWRVEQLLAAQESAAYAREEKASPWLVKALRLVHNCEDIPWGEMPLRNCHNDTKLSNVLFDCKSGKALCLIDLDTLGPGYLLYDLGDALRTLMNPLAEDHPHWDKAVLNLPFYRAFLEGLKESGLNMSAPEREGLPYAPVLMPLLHGLRALTDYLMGDVYYKTTYSEQNLIRACNLLHTASIAADSLEDLKQMSRGILS